MVNVCVVLPLILPLPIPDLPPTVIVTSLIIYSPILLIHSKLLAAELKILGKVNTKYISFTKSPFRLILKDNLLESEFSCKSTFTFGNNSIIYSGARVFDNVKVGKNVICHSNVVIGSDGFSFVSDTREGIEKAMLSRSDEVHMKLNKYLKVESLGSVDIGDNVEIGANCCIDKGTISNTSIGKGTKLDNLVHIAHNVKIGENCLICGQVGIAGSAKIGDRVIMGGQSGVGDNIEVGSDVILAGKTGLSVNAKSNQFLMGNPAMRKSKNIASHMAFRRLPKLIKMLKK